MIHLAPRERTLALVLATGTCILALYGFVVKPTLARTETLQRVIPEKQKELEELLRQGRQILDLQTRTADMSETISNGDRSDLLPWVEAQVKRQGLEQRVTSIQPKVTPYDGRYSQTAVELSLDRVGYRSLLDLMAAMESSRSLTRIASLHITQNTQDPTLLNATVLVTQPTKAPADETT